ncbi:MAG: OmpA family protein [Maricaulaceae bacterium]
MPIKAFRTQSLCGFVLVLSACAITPTTTLTPTGVVAPASAGFGVRYDPAQPEAYWAGVEAMARNRLTPVAMTVVRESDVLRLTLRADDGFERNPPRLSAQGERSLTAVARLMTEYPDLIATVEGHADSVGEAADNDALAQWRADQATAQLLAAGAPAERLIALGYGENRPVATNATASGRAQNRRVEIWLGVPKR